MTSGRKPALTIAQRADVAAAIKVRRALRKRLDELRAQVRELQSERHKVLKEYMAAPSLPDLERKYGICIQALITCVDRPSKTVHPLDAEAAEGVAWR